MSDLIDRLFRNETHWIRENLEDVKKLDFVVLVYSFCLALFMAMSIFTIYYLAVN